MQLKVSRAEAAVVIVIWLVEVIANITALYFELSPQNIDINWGRVAIKLGTRALFWVALTVLYLAWYRTHPILASRWRSGIGQLALSAAAAVALLTAYMGLVYVVTFGISWQEAFEVRWSAAFIYDFTRACVAGLAANAYHFYRRASADERARSQLQLRLATTELMLFRSQLQPHFLFNTLNSITSLVRLGRSGSAVEAIGQLSQLLRYVLDVGQRQLMPLSWELEFTQLYIRLQQLRFGERLTTHIDAIDVDASTAMPVMLLQPLVENAIQHGALIDARPCAIAIRIRQQGLRVSIEVRNPLARTTHMAGGAGLGLTNLTARLRSLYGTTHDFSHGATAEEYIVSVAFPVDTAALASNAAAPVTS